jgi:DNA polymerase-3 subunit gamma/tau
MRDALSILDQVIAFGGDSLVGDEVARVLGVADRAALHGLASAVVSGNAADALRQIEALARGGFDLVHVARDLLRRFRDLVVARVVPEPEPLLDLADAELADVKSLAQGAEADDLARLFQGFSKSMEEIGKTNVPRHALEMAVVRLARRPPMVPVDQLLDRLADLEKRLGRGAPPPGGGGRPAPGGGGGGGAMPRPPVSAPVTQSAPMASTSQAPSIAGASMSAARAVQPSPTARAVQPSSPPAAAVAPSSVVAPQGPIVQPESVLAPSTVERIREMATRLREQKQNWGSLLEHGIVVACDAQRFEIAYEKRSFFAAQVADGAVADAFSRAARSVLGAEAKILLVDGGLEGRTLAQLGQAAKAAARSAAEQSAIAHPVVQDAINIFGAEIKNVKLPGEEV